MVSRTLGRRLGADFGSVRVHIDAPSARDVHAHAYTVGEHLVFDAGRYEPGSQRGQHLIAHELTHVLQQRAARGGARLRPGLSQPGEPSERRAEAVADAVSRSQSASATEAASSGDVVRTLARQAAETGMPADAAGPWQALAEEPAAEAVIGAEGAAGAELGEWDARDGDTPLAGPMLPVPERPEQLEELQAPGDATSAERAEEAFEPAGELVATLADGQPVQRQAKKGKPKSPPTSGVPAKLTRWITTIEIDLTAQTIKVNWSDRSKPQTTSISSGRGRPCTSADPCADQRSENCTPTGSFSPKFRGDSTFHNTHGDPMSWYVDLGITDSKGNGRGIGIHDSQPVKGVPASHGCVRVPSAIAETINKNVIKSTSIDISGKAATKRWTDKSCPPRGKKGQGAGTGGSAPARH
jgi:lipoprotein-anchoring transpeptidase ErfK/SrfK